MPTRADDINDAGVIVGHFLPGAHDHEDGAEHDHENEEETVLPFLRRQDGSVFRFNLPNITQAHFADINDHGVISGFSIGTDSLRQGLVLTPTAPAPNTFFRDTPAGGDDHDHDHEKNGNACHGPGGILPERSCGESSA